MDVNNKNVLNKLNKYIASERLNKSQILQMVNLLKVSHDLNDLKENLRWEGSIKNKNIIIN